jgi:hypothetical protein
MKSPFQMVVPSLSKEAQAAQIHPLGMLLNLFEECLAIFADGGFSLRPIFSWAPPCVEGSVEGSGLNNQQIR